MNVTAASMSPIDKIVSKESAVLFRDIPLLKIGNQLVLFNLQKRQMAELEFSRFEEQINVLDKSGFFDIKIGLTSGENRDQLDLVLIPTNKCNLMCKYCYLGDKVNENPDLDLETAIEFIDKMTKLTSEKDVCINFFGGEPTLNELLIKEVMEHIDKLKRMYPERNFYPGISTNGTMGKEFLNYLLDKGFYFSFSIDGAAEIQNMQRTFKNGKKTSDIVESNLRYLAKRTNSLRSRVTITDRSVDKMDKIVEHLANLGSRLIHFEAAGTYDLIEESRKDFSRPNPEDYIKNFTKSLEKARKLGIKLATTSYHKILFPSHHMCEGISGQRFVISPSGLISYCAEIQYFEHPLSELLNAGNADFYNKSINLKKDLKNKFYLRKYLKMGLEDGCISCFCRYVCSNGCPSHNYNVTKSPFKVDNFYCETTRHLVFYLLNRFYEETKPNSTGPENRQGPNVMNLVTPKEFWIYDKSAYKET